MVGLAWPGLLQHLFSLAPHTRITNCLPTGVLHLKYYMVCYYEALSLGHVNLNQQRSTQQPVIHEQVSLCRCNLENRGSPLGLMQYHAIEPQISKNYLQQ